MVAGFLDNKFRGDNLVHASRRIAQYNHPVPQVYCIIDIMSNK
jgi:hypothetical protein